MCLFGPNSLSHKYIFYLKVQCMHNFIKNSIPSLEKSVDLDQLASTFFRPQRIQSLTLNAPIATKVLCFSHLLKCLWSMTNSEDPDQTAPVGAVCSGSTLFASILNSSVMLGNYLQQMTSADNIFCCIFFLGTFRVKHDNYINDYVWSSVCKYNETDIKVVYGRDNAILKLSKL